MAVYYIVFITLATKMRFFQQIAIQFMMAAISAFPEFHVEDQSNLAVLWEKYLKRFNNLVIIAMNLRDVSRKRALLLHYDNNLHYDNSCL